ncbi:MAG TPA: Rv3235 family protein [Streptosporangiaceae bacterium]|nr:Rv3235 family protein [Streptosporangiaceae bacterium]
MPDTMTAPRAALANPVALLPEAAPLSGLPEAALADAAVIRLVAVPETAPAYDDVRLAGERQAAPEPDALRLAAPGVARTLAARPAAASRSAGGHWPSQFAQVLAETLAGARPASQLAPWTTDRSRRRIGQLGSTLATPHRPRVRRVIVTSPASGVLEMSIIAVFGTRVRALAVRMEHTAPSDSYPAGGAQGGGTPGGPACGGPHQAAGGGGLAAGWYCTAIEAA